MPGKKRRISEAWYSKYPIVLRMTAVVTWVSICSHTPAARNQLSWVLIRDTQKRAVLTIARVGSCKGEGRNTGFCDCFRENVIRD